MLWAVTSYFNPTGSTRRIVNYHAFRRALGVPLLAVEWSRDGRFELDERDADILVRIDGGDLMWQKERLLNIGIERLPASCREVAWLDCDIVFGRADWAAQTSRCLEQAMIVQPYGRAIYLARTPIGRVADPGALRSVARELERVGFVRALLEGTIGELSLAPDDAEVYRRVPSPGFAWAARRELLERHPLIDFWVVGGGDVAYLHAALGTAEHIVRRHGLTAGHRSAYLERAGALAAEVAGRVQFVAGDIFHFWHGEGANRKYQSRFGLLPLHGFEPARSLRAAESGAWSWGEVDPALPRAVSDYFDGRLEDG